MKSVSVHVKCYVYLNKIIFFLNRRFISRKWSSLKLMKIIKMKFIYFLINNMRFNNLNLIIVSFHEKLKKKFIQDIWYFRINKWINILLCSIACTLGVWVLSTEILRSGFISSCKSYNFKNKVLKKMFNSNIVYISTSSISVSIDVRRLKVSYTIILKKLIFTVNSINFLI